MPKQDPTFVTVSNRLPVTLRRGSHGTERIRSSGGLVAAFDPILRQRHGLWVGWPGREMHAGESVSSPDDPYQIEPVSIAKADVKGYYHGFSNGALWPLFHTLPGRSTFESSDWDSYQRVNEQFAEVTAKALRPDDFVLVNDYHLLLLPERLRQRRRRAAIGFFLHVPFPPYDVFRVLPWARPLLRGMLGADLVGFHVSNYVRNFLDCVNRLLGCRVDHRRGIVHLEDRTVRVQPLPLGIDFDHYESIATNAPDSGFGASERIILGVDRLDYTKGIPERLRAFQRFLVDYPEHRNTVTLIQLAVPSRADASEYRQLKREIDGLVGLINGRFGTATWTPIRYLYRSLPQDRLCALYRDADIALVTPLRDGMNLVAKEYVACQVAEPGVLVLSHMAGAAETMAESLLVNPYNIEDTAVKLHRALLMSTEERASRMKALRRREATLNVHTWAKKLLQRLGSASKDNRRASARSKR
jgi:trehalose 6-phosphate synthase/phosphatase